MPIKVTHNKSSGLAALAALVGGQGQRRERDENRDQAQRLDIEKFMRQMAEQRRQFDAQQGLAQREQGFRERSTGRQQSLAEKQAAFQRQFSVDQAQDQSSLAKMRIAAQMSSQRLSQAAAAARQNQSMAAQFAQMGQQAAVGDTRFAQQLAAQAQAQAARSGEHQQSNIFQASAAALNSEFAQLLKHKYPSEQAQAEVFEEHNARRAKLGLPPVSNPPWQAPPKSFFETFRESIPEEDRWMFVPDDQGHPQKIRGLEAKTSSERKMKEEEDLREQKFQIDLARAKEMAKAEFAAPSDTAGKERRSVILEREKAVAKRFFEIKYKSSIEGEEDPLKAMPDEDLKAQLRNEWDRSNSSRPDFPGEVQPEPEVPGEQPVPPVEPEPQGAPPSVSQMRGTPYEEILSGMPTRITRNQMPVDSFKVLVAKRFGVETNILTEIGQSPFATSAHGLDTRFNIEQDARAQKLFETVTQAYNRGIPFYTDLEQAKRDLKKGDDFIGPDMIIYRVGNPIVGALGKAAVNAAVRVGSDVMTDKMSVYANLIRGIFE